MHSAASDPRLNCQPRFAAWRRSSNESCNLQNRIGQPESLNLDMNLVKRVKITENKEFEMRMDAINMLNHPLFATPNLNINNAAFGRITTATGARTFVLNARLNF